MKKPSLGLVPDYIWKERVQKWIDMSGGITISDSLRFKIGRIEEIEKAITRYEQAGQEVPDNWVAEGVGLIKELISYKAEWTN